MTDKEKELLNAHLNLRKSTEITVIADLGIDGCFHNFKINDELNNFVLTYDIRN